MLFRSLPVLTRLTEEKERQKNALRKMFRFGAFLSFPLILGLAFVGKEFLIIVGGGDKWLPALPYLQIFCIWNSVYFMWSLYTNLLLSHGKSNIFMYGMIFVGILQLLSVALMFRFGIIYMVIAYVISFFFGILFWHYQTNKIIQLKLFHVIKDISPYLITTIGCIFVTFIITKDIEYIYMRIALKITVTAILYFVIMWYSNSIIVKESVNFFKQKLKF